MTLEEIFEKSNRGEIVEVFVVYVDKDGDLSHGFHAKTPLLLAGIELGKKELMKVMEKKDG